MANNKHTSYIENSWQSLTRYTDARIGIGRAGTSLPTHEHLKFQLAHACAQDAVKRAIDWHELHSHIQQRALLHLHLTSKAEERNQYLQRPDLGRKLTGSSEQQLKLWRNASCSDVDFVVVIADGLSSLGIEQHGTALLTSVLDRYGASSLQDSTRRTLICTVDQGRVAIGDHIAQIVGARFTAVIIGERPGLSSPDSIGIYFTLNANTQCSDADRNCISNIRPNGLSFDKAGERLLWLMEESQKRNLSGVALKDESEEQQVDMDLRKNFLLP